MLMGCEEATTLLINIDITKEDERTSYTISEHARWYSIVKSWSDRRSGHYYP
jgi:hypothetical protein